MNVRMRYEVICSHCNKTFDVILSRIKRGNCKFCSNKCRTDDSKGKTISEDHIKALSSANIGNKYRSGKKISERHKEIVRLNFIKWHKENPNYTHSQETREKISKANTKSSTNYDSRERMSPQYRSWRRKVWLRDNFMCKTANPECSGRIEAHHILPWRDYPDLRYKVNNGITLCHAHHPRKRAEEKRLVPVFQELVSVSSS